MSALEQEQRIARAIREMADWTIEETEFAFVVTTRGGRYEVTAWACTCADHVKRCAGTEARCKHRFAVGETLLEQGRDPESVLLAKAKAAQEAERRAFRAREAALSPEERAKRSAQMERIFG